MSEVKKLFLDDFREPWEVSYSDDWIVVRSFGCFADWIDENGLPDIVSFDHDLADNHILRAALPVKSWYSESKERAYTGLDCARYVVECCMDDGLPLPEFLVHSANPEGKEKIETLLNNFKQYGRI